MGSDSDGDDYEKPCHSRRSRDFSIHQAQRPTLLLILVLIEDEDSRRLRHVVDARDR